MTFTTLITTAVIETYPRTSFSHGASSIALLIYRLGHFIFDHPNDCCKNCACLTAANRLANKCANIDIATGVRQHWKKCG